MSTPVKLSAPDARAIAAELLSGNDQLEASSKALASIASDLSVAGMQGEAGRAVARKQEELTQRAGELIKTSREQAEGLNNYATLVEQTQAEDAAAANAV
ncbi:hypothetical protein [Rhodococcus baikonurensis]|jgi:uncharacterized protein YukE|uniref:Excreted virulence factor EspC, type VII ESX diderm n=1 Tax=Rhodococcus baikonurensis TaxID=172041 RepID=A0ABV5XT86_9NOCA